MKKLIAAAVVLTIAPLLAVAGIDVPSLPDLPGATLQAGATYTVYWATM